MATIFIADVGGTNIRLAQKRDGKLVEVKKYLCNDFDSIDSVIQYYFDQYPEQVFTAGCVAIACPVTGDWVKMTNHSWQFSIQKLKNTLQLDWLAVINDFDSVAHSLPVLDDNQKVQIGGGAANVRGNIAVFGPGTGLGVSHLTYTQQGWQALDGEGGHVDFAPVDERDITIWNFLRNKYGHASAEEVMSGRGLVQIYQALAENQGLQAKYSDAADITARALDGSCALCQDTLAQFCRIMGSFGGNLALNLATTGGVYIGGGIAPRFIDYIKQSDFRARFEAKGRFKDYVASIPVYIITEPDHGLIGAAAYLEQNYIG